MSADALELALALHQAPIERFGLRDRPLPKNIGEALQLASAMQPQLEAAAARFSESEETIVEAVRFYLHQVLFEPGTDAYRVLGLAPNADIKLIRQHHIWLQRWLHPDRRGEDWEAMLATKVNWAWQQLRNDASREEYDQMRLASMQTVADDSADEGIIQAPAWSAAPVGKARPHWLRRSVIGGLLVFCGGLLYLGVTRQDRVDPDALAIRAVDSQSSIRPRVPFEVDATRETSAPIAEPVEIEPPPSLVSEDPTALPDSVSEARETQANAPPTAKASVAAASNAPIEKASNWKPAPLSGQTDALPTIADGHSSRPIDPIADSRERKGLPKQQSLTSASATKIDRPSLNQTVSSEAPSAVVVQEPKRALATEKIVAERNGTDLSEKQAQIPIYRHSCEGRNPASSALCESPKALDARLREDDGLKAVPFVAERVTPMAAAPPSANVAKAVPRPTQKMEEVAPDRIPQPSIASIPSSPVEANSEMTDRTASPASDAGIELATQSQNEPSEQTSPEELSRETLARFEVARKRVSGMIDFFRNQDASAAKWGDDQGLLTVERERSAMLARNGQGIEKFALDPPTWRITNAMVSLHANYHVDAKNDSAESGQFQLSMAWREGGWKITRIEVSPSR